MEAGRTDLTFEGYWTVVIGEDGKPIRTTGRYTPGLIVCKEHVARAAALYLRRPRGLVVPRDRVRCTVFSREFLLATDANLILAEFKVSDSGRLIRKPPSASAQAVAAELMSIYGVDTPLASLPERESGPDGLLTKLAALLLYDSWFEFHYEEFAETPLGALLHTMTKWVAEKAIKEALRSPGVGDPEDESR